MLLRVSQAAKLLGVSRQRLYVMIEEGKINTYEVGGYKLIDRDEIIIRKKNHPPDTRKGPPRKDSK